MSFTDFFLLGGKYKNYKNKEEGYSLSIPNGWRLASVTDDYGHVFSAAGEEEGRLAVRISSSLFEKLDDFAEDLIYAMEKRNGYRIVSKNKAQAAKCNALELVFDAKATSMSRELDAKLITTIIHDIKNVRFVLITFSVLKGDYEKLLPIYEEAKKSFRVSMLK